MVANVDLWLIGIEPCTLNSAYESTSEHYKCKSSKTHAWLYYLEKAIMHYHVQIDNLRAKWKPSEHYLLVNYSHFIPENQLFVQKNNKKHRSVKGAISKVSRDWSNIPKIPDDLIFNKLLEIDDGHICTGVVNKFPSPNAEFYLLLKLQIRTIKELRERAARALPDFMKHEIKANL